MKHLARKMDAVMRLCIADDEQTRQQIREEIRYLLLHNAQETLDAEEEIREILLELGAPDHLVGHPYVIRAVMLVMGERLYINNMVFGLYPQVAAEFDTTVARVERAIRHLIEVTWSRGDQAVLQKYFGNTVSASRGKPTNGEFIARIANIVKARMRYVA